MEPGSGAQGADGRQAPGAQPEDSGPLGAIAGAQLPPPPSERHRQGLIARSRRKKRRRSAGLRTAASVLLVALALTGSLWILAPIVLQYPGLTDDPPTAAPASSALPALPFQSGQPAGSGGLPVVVGPSDAPPSGDSSSQPGSAGVLRRIVIKDLGIDVRVIEGNGVDGPLNAVAHYPGTAWPGGGSNIYVYGHARAGLFLNLWKAKVGQVVTATLVGGGSRDYVITQVLPSVSWDALQYLDPTPGEQLTLQTCTGSGPDVPRFLVIAVPKGAG